MSPTSRIMCSDSRMQVSSRMAAAFTWAGDRAGDEAGVAEAGEGFHVVGVPFAVDSGGGVGARFAVEDGLDRVGFLAGGDFAFAVEVPDGLREGFGDVGVFFLEGVPDVVRGDDVGLAAFQRAVDAQQADDVAVVGVEELARARAVDAHFVDLRRVRAGVFDVAEDVAQAVLRDEVAEVGSKAHVGYGGFVVAPFLHGQAFEEEEAFAVEDVVAQGVEEVAESGEGEFCLSGWVSVCVHARLDCRVSSTYPCDTSQWCARLDESIRSIAQLLHLLGSETMCPLLGIVLEVLSCPHGLSSDLLGESRVRLDLIEVGRSLAAGLDAIREDLG